MTTKYKTDWQPSKIQEISIDRETNNRVWINGKVFHKRAECQQYFDTWEQAHAYLLSRAEQKAADARIRLGQVNGELGNVKGMIKEREKEMNNNGR